MHNREVHIITDAYRTKESNALRTCCNRSGGQCCLLRRVSNNIHSTPASTALLANMAPVAGQGGQGEVSKVRKGLVRLVNLVRLGGHTCLIVFYCV